MLREFTRVHAHDFALAHGADTSNIRPPRDAQNHDTLMGPEDNVACPYPDCRARLSWVETHRARSQREMAEGERSLWGRHMDWHAQRRVLEATQRFQEEEDMGFQAHRTVLRAAVRAVQGMAP